MSSRLALLWLLLAGITLGLPLRPADASPGFTERVSVDSNGNQANGQSTGPSISATGRYIAFVSGAPNLVSGDTDAFPNYHAYLKDRVSGEIRRISAGKEVDSANVIHTAISDDGRLVAFNTYPAGAAVYDRDSGRVQTVSGLVIDMSGDGRFLAVGGFPSGLRDLDNDESEPLPAGSRMPSPNYDGSSVAHIDSAGRVAVLDRQSGKTEIVGLNGAGEAIGLNNWPSISNDDRYVAFESQAPNIAAGDAPDTPDVFVRDRLLGETILVSRDLSGLPSGGTLPQISANGRRVLYTSSYLTGEARLILHNLDTGITETVSVNSLGEEANDSVPGVSGAPQDLSADGRFIAFESNATNLVPNDTNECGMGGGAGSCTDIFVHDRGSQPEAPSPLPFEPPPASPSPEPTTTPTAALCGSSTPTSSPSPEVTISAEPPVDPSSIPNSAAEPTDAPPISFPGSPPVAEQSPATSPVLSPSATASPEPTSCEDARADDEIAAEEEVSLNIGRLAGISAAGGRRSCRPVRPRPHLESAAPPLKIIGGGAPAPIPKS